MKKDVYANKGTIQIIRQLVTKDLGEEQTQAVFNEARKHFSELCERYEEGLSKQEKSHTRGIFKGNALYNALKPVAGEERALAYIIEGYKLSASQMGRQLDMLISLPGMTRFFIWMFGYMGGKMFGDTAGFRQRCYDKKPGETRFDILECPYQKYCTLCGNPELTHIFCDNDIYMYGNLKKVRFTRTQTLGTGGECCDFFLARR